MRPEMAFNQESVSGAPTSFKLGDLFGDLGNKAPTPVLANSSEKPQNNEPKPETNEGVSIRDNVTADAGIGLLFGGISPVMSMAMNTAGTVGDLSDEHGYQMAMQAEKQAMQAEIIAKNRQHKEFVVANDTAFGAKAKHDISGVKAFSYTPSQRPSESDGQGIRTLDMNAPIAVLQRQMSGPKMGYAA